MQRVLIDHMNGIAGKGFIFYECSSMGAFAEQHANDGLLIFREIKGEREPFLFAGLF
jgi:hypothetical protein